MKKELAASQYMDGKVIPVYTRARVTPITKQCARRLSPWLLAVKRAIDVFSAVFVLVFGFPFYALIAAIIKLTSEGPVLYVQERLGQDGRPFRFYKFRTMLHNSDDGLHRDFTENFIKGKLMEEEGDSETKPVYKLTRDPRVTPVGRFLRRTSLDELPQFINVLKGEMSLVGPRPPLAYEIEHYKEWHRGRLAVKPGLTGLWQVSGRSSVPFDEMVMLDLYYIENWSLLLDLKIIMRTLPVMFFGSGAY